MGTEGQTCSRTTEGTIEGYREHAARHRDHGTAVSITQSLEPHPGSSMSRFVMTALIDPRRVSHMIHRMLLQQQTALEKFGSPPDISTQSIINMTISNHSSPPSLLPIVQAQLSDIKPSRKQSTQVLSKPTKLLPWTVQVDLPGFVAQVAALPKGKGKTYQAAIHLSLLGKMFLLELNISCPSFSFDRMLHVRNIVPADSPMTLACKTGDFDCARRLLASGAAQGSDITLAGWPMLDVGAFSLCMKCPMLMTWSSTLSRAGLPGSSACSSNTERIPTWLTGNITCE